MPVEHMDCYAASHLILNRPLKGINFTPYFCDSGTVTQIGKVSSSGYSKETTGTINGFAAFVDVRA